jgi:hypothetical protein
MFVARTARQHWMGNFQYFKAKLPSVLWWSAMHPLSYVIYRWATVFRIKARSHLPKCMMSLLGILLYECYDLCYDATHGHSSTCISPAVGTGGWYRRFSHRRHKEARLREYDVEKNGINLKSIEILSILCALNCMIRDNAVPKLYIT